MTNSKLIIAALSTDFPKIQRHLIDVLGCSADSVSELTPADVANQAVLMFDALKKAGGSLHSLLLLDAMDIEEASDDEDLVMALDGAMALLEWNRVAACDCGEWRLL